MCACVYFLLHRYRTASFAIMAIFQVRSFSQNPFKA